jgi:hypothetical protein
MTLQEIKSAVDAGKIVHWSSLLYQVVKDNRGEYLIKCGQNYIGLTWADGVTLNGKEKDFFINVSRREFNIFKEGATDKPITIISKDGEPFDREERINFYRSMGYTVTTLEDEND